MCALAAVLLPLDEDFCTKYNNSINIDGVSTAYFFDMCVYVQCRVVLVGVILFVFFLIC